VGNQVQAAPLSVNPLGAAVLPVWPVWKPIVVEPPGAMAPLAAGGRVS
jgi:hypothetical protein